MSPEQFETSNESLPPETRVLRWMTGSGGIESKGHSRDKKRKQKLSLSAAHSYKLAAF